VKPLQLDKAGDTVPDPHVWGDVENAIAMVNAIRRSAVARRPLRIHAECSTIHTRVEAAGCLDYPADSNYT